MNKDFKTKSFKHGGYSVAVACILLVILILVNVLVYALPSTYTQLDISTNRLFSISDQTKSIVASIDHDVDVFWIVRQGQEDDSLRKLIDRYKDLSPLIHFQTIDPDVYPYFASQYTDADVTDNSLIVSDGNRSRFIDSNDIYEYDYLLYMYSGDIDANFAGEGVITSAIDYVCNGNFNTVYFLTGHGETELTMGYKDSLTKDNIELVELNYLTAGKIPEDAGAIMISAPSKDISEDEAKGILEYLQNGGRMMLVTSPSQETDTFPNLMSVMEYYGCTLDYGVILERDAGYFVQQPYYLLPKLETHTITQPLTEENFYVFLPLCQGIVVSEDLRETESVDTLMWTSDKSIAKGEGLSSLKDVTTVDFEDGDRIGPFCLAVDILDNPDTEQECRIVWFASKYVMEEAASQRVAGGNQDVFINGMNWIVNNDLNITIQSKHLSNEYLTIPEAVKTPLTIVFSVLMPLLFLAAGIVVWIKRRKL